jgi:hypothetical protein
VQGQKGTLGGYKRTTGGRKINFQEKFPLQNAGSNM